MLMATMTVLVAIATVLICNDDRTNGDYDRPNGDKVPDKRESSSASPPLRKDKRSVVTISSPFLKTIPYKRFSRSSAFSNCQKKRPKPNKKQAIWNELPALPTSCQRKMLFTNKKTAGIGSNFDCK